ncbi:MAG: response regulator transcription factor [Dehalococcoidales bacterium]|nr:response regulator transcription factor [Dehalococcoidales bacterium]
MPKKILIADDDPAMLRLVEQVLTGKGYAVLKAGNGQEALRLLFAEKPDLVLLDVVMPGLDGWETCTRMRDVSDIPVIMLTGKRGTEDDIVQGLDHGADEYLLKPIGNRELIARVRAALRRADLCATPGKTRQIRFDDNYLCINVAEHRVTVKGERVKLTPHEFRLLALLVENAGSIVTHRQVLERVWGWEYIDDVDYVRIYVSHLRQKIEPDLENPRYILTESGVGYYFHKLEQS